jgi:hypothetical protein
MSNEVELPPLPDEQLLGAEVCGHVAEFSGYTADQMRDFARAAVLQERERCARVCEEQAEGEDQYCCQPLATSIAAAIRKPSPPDSHNGCG